MKHFKKIVFTVAVIAIVCLSIYSYSSWLAESDYWGSAPDGTYLVFVSGEIEQGQMWFPICEHSGGNLHGSWKIAENITMPDSVTWYNETNALIDLYPNGTGIYGPKSYRSGYAMATLKDNVVVNLQSNIGVSEHKDIWQGCPGPFDLVSILPVIFVCTVVVFCGLALYIWRVTKRFDTQHEMQEVKQ